MTAQCNAVQDLMVEYISQNLSRDDVNTVIIHLSQCKTCRKELSELIALKKQLNSLMADVPLDIKKSVFESIPKKSNILVDILRAISPFESSNITEYAFGLVNKIVKIVLQSYRLDNKLYGAHGAQNGG